MIPNNIRNLARRPSVDNESTRKQVRFDIPPETMKLIRKLHGSWNTNVRTYFQETSNIVMF